MGILSEGWRTCGIADGIYRTAVVFEFSVDDPCRLPSFLPRTKAWAT